MKSMLCRSMTLTLAVLAWLPGFIVPQELAAASRIVKVQTLRPTGPLKEQAEAISRGVYVERVALEETLLDLLRWHAVGASSPGCPSSTAVDRPTEAVYSLIQLDTKLKEAGDQLLHMDLEQAQASLTMARGMLECLDAPVSRSTLRTLFVLEAVVLATQGSPKADAAFRQLLAVDPRPFLEPEHPPKVRKMYLAVAERELKAAPLEVSLEGLEGEVWVNGQSVTGQVDLRPGLHLVQLRGPAGIVLSQLVKLPLVKSPPPRLVELLPRPLPSREPLEVALERGLRENALELAQQRALIAWLQQQQHAAVAFLLSEQNGKPELRVVGADGQLLPWNSALERLPPGNVQKIPIPPVVVGAQLRVGAGVTLAQQHQTLTGVSTLEALLEIRRLRLQLSVNGRSDLNGLGIYPTLAGSGMLGVRLPLNPGMSLVPLVGYGIGQGPLLAFDDCGRVDVATIACGEGAGSTQVWTGSFGHGPILRLEVQVDPPSTGKRLPWSVQVGLQASTFFQAVPQPATITLSSEGSSTPYEVRFPSLSTDLAMRLEALLGYQRRF